MKARRRVEFTGVELAAPVEKVATRSVEKAEAGPHALEGHGGLPAPQDSHPRFPYHAAVRVSIVVLVSHAPRALLARGSPEPPFPPTRVGLGTVVALLVGR